MSEKIHISWEQLQKVAPTINTSAGEFIQHLNAVMDEYHISNTIPRVAMFLSQAMHECQNFSKLEENLRYSADRLMAVWPNRFPDIAFAQQFAYNPIKLGNYVYANRYGNGAPETGDGYKYRGRGIFMTTFKSNYQHFGERSGVGPTFFVANPDLVSNPKWACESAGIYWDSKDLNALSDAKDVKAVRQAINGGVIGLKDCRELFDKLCEVLTEDNKIIA